jgi:hypothetical protein
MSELNKDNVDFASKWSVVIGRVGMITNLISRPDLNESLGRVIGYDNCKKRYCVKCVDGADISIKVENLVFIDILPEEFTQHSSLIACQMGPDAVLNQCLSPGAVISLADGSSLIYPQIMITQPCLIRGNDIGNCVVKSMFILDLKSNYRVEFENVHFSTTLDNSVLVLAGSSALFRNCTFAAYDASFASDANSVVHFDTCVFERARGSGSICAGKQVMKHCIIRNTGGFGIEVRDQGILKASQCQITNTGRAGVIGYKNAQSIEMVDSSILRSADSGVLILEGCSGTIRNCDIREARVAGIAIQHRASAWIEACTIKSCLQGVLAQTGKCTVTVKSCSIEKCKMHGIFIAIDCRGKVTLSDNSLKNNGCKNINNDSVDAYCEVVVDGIVMSSRGGVMSQVQPNVRAQLFEAAADITDPHETPATLNARSKVGLVVIACGGCGVERNADVKFFTCSQCLEAKYCSKECQKKHWKRGHKLDCVKRIEHPSLLNPNQSIDDVKPRNV